MLYFCFYPKIYYWRLTYPTVSISYNSQYEVCKIIMLFVSSKPLKYSPFIFVPVSQLAVCKHLQGNSCDGIASSANNSHFNVYFGCVCYVAWSLLCHLYRNSGWSGWGKGLSCVGGQWLSIPFWTLPVFLPGFPLRLRLLSVRSLKKRFYTYIW